MPLSLTTRRRQQTSTKWSSSQQHLTQHFQDLSNTQHSIRHHHIQQPVRKQISFIEPSHLNKARLSAYTGRNYLSRGLSVERSHDIQRLHSKQISKKHSHLDNGKTERTSLKSEDLIQKNISACGPGGEFLRNSRRLQAWSSTSSILKSLDKELAQLNDVVGKCKETTKDIANAVFVDNDKKIKTKADSLISTHSHGTHVTRKSSKPESNKVNLSIVLSHALNASKEETDCVLSNQEDEEDSDDISTDSGKNLNSPPKYTDSKKSEIAGKSLATSANQVPAQQRRALYHNSRLASNLTLTSSNTNNPTTLNIGLQNPHNFNASPSLTVQKRPPLVRAMSAPVRSFDESTKGTFLAANKRKSRRRKLNTRQISCDRESLEPLITKNSDFDLKTSSNNKKGLTRSKSVAPDVITLVSLISSEGSDSEKEDFSTTPSNSDTNSPARRAPSLRKTGKSVSFQENYPPTFQFASKEYSHMLRRGSIAPLAQRIKANRPPTAPPGSIFHTANKSSAEMYETKDILQEKENQNEKLNTTSTSTLINANKALEEVYKFPEYVRSLKERECWKLFMKMSTKGVNITYDTILRGMLTPTEFRQLQKQREIEEAKALKENEELAVNEIKPKGPATAIERLSESLLKK